MNIFKQKHLTLKLIVAFFIFMALSSPPVFAETFQCMFEDDQGVMQRCIDREFGVHWPYTVSDEGTYYNITRKGEWLALPIHEAIEYDFSTTKISIMVSVTAANQFNSFSNNYNQSHRKGSVSTQGSSDLLEFIWDYKNTIMQTLPDGNLSIVEIDSFSAIEGNDIVFYFEKFSGDVDYPVYIIFDSYIINAIEGWNGTDFQTSRDENQSVIIDYDESTPILAQATSSYTMDNTNATYIFDENSTNNNDGEITGATLDAVGWRGAGLGCDGNDFVDIPANTSYVNNNFTFSFWINSKNITLANKVFFSKRVGENGYKFYTISSRPYGFYWIMGNTDVFSLTAIESNRWYHITYVVDGTAQQIYLDGILNREEVGTAAVDVLSKWRMCREGTTSNYFNGTIDEIRYWNRALTGTEIATVFNNSYYSSGNFTSDDHDAGAGNILTNVSVNFTSQAGNTVDIFVNGSNNGWTTDQMVLVKIGAVTNTFYDVPTAFRDYNIILQLGTSSASTPAITSIETGEGLDNINPNIIHQLPANESVFLQSGETVNIPFSVFCTDNVQCDNATLHIFNSTFHEINFTEIHRVTEMKLINGTAISGSVSDLDQDDGVYVTVQEAGPAQPAEFCIDVFFNFTNVPTDHDHVITVDGRYTGGGAHFTNFLWRNYSAPGEVFVSFANFTKTAQDQQFTSVEINATQMTDGNGNATIKLQHDDGSCVSGHLMLIDLMQLEATNHNKDFTNGFLNFTVPLSAADDTRYWYYFEAWDTSGNNDQFEFNYTFTIESVQPTGCIISLPTNKTYTAISDLPFRITTTEVEVDKYWYSLNDTTNITFSPNTTLFNTPNGFYTLKCYINTTNGRTSNQTNITFTVDYDGFGIEPEGLGGEFMDTSIFIMLNILAFGLALVTLFITKQGTHEKTFTSLLSMILFFGLALWSQDLSHFTGGTSITYTIAGFLWLYAGLGFVMFIFALVNFLFATVKPMKDPYGADITDGKGYGIFQDGGLERGEDDKY